ncbi:MAG: metallophosphatase family protein [Firmicutes bacterium]|nr:metallophosphatase family protein [Bacillota bacterium]
MKALVISDTHVRSGSEISKLISIIKPYVSEADIIIHAGDLVSRALINSLNDLKPTYAVSGNMDQYDVAQTLPQKMVFEFDSFKVGLTHGSGPATGLRERVFDLFQLDAVDAIIFGHSHQPYLGVQDGVLMLNPGSPTDTRFADRNTLAFLYADDKLRAEIIDI